MTTFVTAFFITQPVTFNNWPKLRVALLKGHFLAVKWACHNWAWSITGRGPLPLCLIDPYTQKSDLTSHGILGGKMGAVSRLFRVKGHFHVGAYKVPFRGY